MMITISIAPNLPHKAPGTHTNRTDSHTDVHNRDDHTSLNHRSIAPLIFLQNATTLNKTQLRQKRNLPKD